MSKTERVLAGTERWAVACGDALTVARSLPDGCVQTCVTSPPYFGLRQYLFDKAVVPRYNLTYEEREWLLAELKRRGIKPKH